VHLDSGNVLDLCAVAVPAGTYTPSDDTSEASKLPFSVMFLGRSCSDSEVLGIAGQFDDYVRQTVR
jgi:Asp-tRNA(Asn)/Glu-tRNA(Gln) amidotransferase A subunit family amidase